MLSTQKGTENIWDVFIEFTSSVKLIYAVEEENR